MGLEALPDEILCEIIELVSIPRKNHPGHPTQACLGTRDLLSTMLCNHRLYSIGGPILYRTLIQRTRKGLPDFIRSTLARPDLTDHVRALDLTEDDYERSLAISNTFTDEMLQEMHYHLESRALDDQLEALSNESINKEPNWASAETTSTCTGESPRLIQTLNESSTTQVPAPIEAGSSKVEQNPTLVQTFNGGTGNDPFENAYFPAVSHASEDADSLMYYIKCGRWKGLATYILYRLPYIESISIEVYRPASEHTENDHLDALFQRAISPETITIPKLHELSISYPKRNVWSKFDPFFPLLKHPSLRSFSADNIREFGWLPSPRNLKLPLTSLTLSRCNLSTSSIDALLKCCPNLEYLKYEHDQSWSEQHFTPKSFATSIKHLKDSLRELVLYRAAAHNRSHHTNATEFSIIGPCLTQFKLLTSLSITANLLLGLQKSEGSDWARLSAQYVCDTQSLLNALPSSLETLILKECGDEILKDVEDLVEQSTIIVPRLKEVVLGVVDSEHSHYFGGFKDRVWRREVVHRGLNMGELNRLEEDCKRKGIVFDVLFG